MIEIWATILGHAVVPGLPCSKDNAELIGLGNEGMVTFRLGMPLRTISGSVVLMQPGSVVVSMAHVATKSTRTPRL